MEQNNYRGGVLDNLFSIFPIAKTRTWANIMKIQMVGNPSNTKKQKELVGNLGFLHIYPGS